jgi:predicted acyl esterase
VSYTTRGFWNAGGVVELASPNDVKDAQHVVDWAIQNTCNDSNGNLNRNVGVGGMSYGAGIGLLLAAQDSRIKAVGMLSGWFDLESCFYQNGGAINWESTEWLEKLGECIQFIILYKKYVFREYKHSPYTSYNYM